MTRKINDALEVGVQERETPESVAAPPLAWEEPHPVLLPWRQNVGAPVILELAPPLAAPPPSLEVLCWNLAIGAARLGELLERLRSEVPGGIGTRADRPLVILAQEAYRADETVPPLPVGAFHGGSARGSNLSDVVALAREHGMSLRYVPSMRNGAARSDRGNAILASCAIASTHAFSLPFLRQRRMAVAVELEGIPKLALVSAHFENRSRLALGLRSALGFGSSRAEQAEALGRRIIAAEGGDVLLGADLNTPRGDRDPAYTHLLRAGFRAATRQGNWSHTYHGLLRLPLDHVLFHSGGGPVRSVRVRRIDEHPGDRPRRIFGSDHHPLLATVELAVPASDRGLAGRMAAGATS
jgi:endonuclease/exonuclease/phosphatase family metal-dependent hydrolase